MDAIGGREIGRNSQLTQRDSGKRGEKAVRQVWRELNGGDSDKRSGKWNWEKQTD
jgi:hypothetical protein